MAHFQLPARAWNEDLDVRPRDPREYRDFTVSDQAHVIAGDVHFNSVNPRDIILDSLHFPGMERYHQRPLENHPDTFDWLFDQRSRLHVCDFEDRSKLGQCDSEHDCNLVEAELRRHASKLQTWLETSDDIFWISGKAGSGKSTFMKFLFEHQQTQVHLKRWAGGDVIAAAFFFWRAGSSELEKSYIGLLQGLLYQVLQERRELIELVLPQRWRAVLRSPTYKKPWTKSELVTAFDLLLQAPETNLRFCFFIDGLDEFDGDHRDLIDAIRSFGKSPFVKICVSSRPWGSFQREYGSDERLHVILHTLTKRDIDTYIVTKLETAACSAPGVYCTYGLRQLENAVYARSEGVFLWVALAVRDLRRGIEEQDSLSVLHDRLEGYPSELRDFIQRIFNGIDPAYKRLTGRLLLMMLEDTGPPALITLNFLGDSFAADGEYIMDPHWTPRSDAEMYSLIDRAAMCANKWCRDLLLPVNTRDVKEKISTVLSGRYSFRSREVTLSFFATGGMEFIHLISYLSFGHRSIHQFAEEKATDGTLSEMAGRKFDPRLAWLCTFVEISRCAPNLIEFTEVFRHASWLLLGMDEHNLVGIALEEKTLMNGIQQCLEAFDSIGQDIQKHSSWRHWTAERLAADEHIYPQLRSRMPAANDCSSFLSYLACLVFPDDFLSQVLTKHVSLTELQKQFVLETCLIPFLYSDSDAETKHHVDEDRRGPRSHCRIIVQIIESGIDVNRPTKRLICHQDYSVWQFFLLWLHDYFHENPLFRCPDRCATFKDGECCYTRDKALYVEDAIKIFRSFLHHGADPFVVISSTDLIECQQRHPLKNRATFLNVADVLHDLRTVAMSDSALFADEIPWLAAHVAAVGDLETLLNEAYAQRYRESLRSET